jgi:hypothetical protein
MSAALKPQPFDEASARDALAHEFQKLGLAFSVMEQAVISTATSGTK